MMDSVKNRTTYVTNFDGKNKTLDKNTKGLYRMRAKELEDLLQLENKTESMLTEYVLLSKAPFRCYLCGLSFGTDRGALSIHRWSLDHAERYDDLQKEMKTWRDLADGNSVDVPEEDDPEVKLVKDLESFLQSEMQFPLLFKKCMTVLLHVEVCCDLCNTVCKDRKTFLKHLQNQKHFSRQKDLQMDLNQLKLECFANGKLKRQENTEEITQWYYPLQVNSSDTGIGIPSQALLSIPVGLPCNLCDLSYYGLDMLLQHRLGQKHSRRLDGLRREIEKWRRSRLEQEPTTCIGKLADEKRVQCDTAEEQFESPAASANPMRSKLYDTEKGSPSRCMLAMHCDLCDVDFDDLETLLPVPRCHGGKHGKRWKQRYDLRSTSTLNEFIDVNRPTVPVLEKENLQENVYQYCKENMHQAEITMDMLTNIQEIDRLSQDSLPVQCDLTEVNFWRKTALFKHWRSPNHIKIVVNKVKNDIHRKNIQDLEDLFQVAKEMKCLLLAALQNPALLQCDLCDLEFKKRNALLQHLQSRKHARRRCNLQEAIGQERSISYANKEWTNPKDYLLSRIKELAQRLEMDKYTESQLLEHKSVTPLQKPLRCEACMPNFKSRCPKILLNHFQNPYHARRRLDLHQRIECEKLLTEADVLWNNPQDYHKSYIDKLEWRLKRDNEMELLLQNPPHVVCDLCNIEYKNQKKLLDHAERGTHARSCEALLAEIIWRKHLLDAICARLETELREGFPSKEMQSVLSRLAQTRQNYCILCSFECIPPMEMARHLRDAQHSNSLSALQYELKLKVSAIQCS